ncbi:MAG: SpoIIE family protein phosphatase [Deferrisomatales bacterium]
MNRTVWVAGLGLSYLLGLFAIAYAADRARSRGRSPVDNPWVYSFSLAVYCTSWTFYGSVGRAASQGLGFLPIYLGPTLVFFLAPTLLRRLVSHCRAEGVTSVPDLLESLYGKGRALGALATTALVAGVTPYIGLQLKAIGHTFDLIAGRGATAGVLGDAAFWAALGLSVFSMLFGARTLVATERHEGMVAAVAFESAVKLGAFLALGIYITWGIGGGLGAVFDRALARPDLAHLFLLGREPGTSAVQWASLSALSGAAVILLPRQFHMLAVENVRDEHLLPASWVFPTYLLLINLLVLPVALVGLLEGAPGSPDFFMISLPLSRGHSTLAFLAFLGGFSAATSMVIVSSVALSTMILHHPGVAFFGGTGSAFREWGELDLSRPLLYAKRVMILGVILLGYGFKRWIGDSHTLVNIGLLSFSAVTQFAPAVLLGLYWKGGTRAGALTGLGLGFGVWAYTLLLPSFVESGWVGAAILERGPWGVELLRPQALFGLEGLDPWTHALIWSLVLNLGGYLTVSLFAGPSSAGAEAGGAATRWISRTDLEQLLTRFVGAAKAREVLEGIPETASSRTLLDEAQRCLAGALGTPSARMILQSFQAWPQEQAVQILDVFGGVTQTLAESRETLERRLRELVVLHEASRTLSSSLDLDTVLSQVLHLIRREFGFEYLAVRLLDPDGCLRIRSHVGLEEEYIRISAIPPSKDTYFGTCFLEGRPVVVEDTRQVTKPLLFQHLARNVPVAAFIHAPMVHEGRPIGVLTAYATQGPMGFTEEFIDLFAALANQLALAVVNARLYAEVQAYSHAMEEKVRRRTAELEAANARLRELDRLKSDFLSTVSHELRTPLTSIRSFTEILLRYGVDDAERRQNFIEIIHAEAERLSRMINELLDLSKIEAGRFELHPAPLPVQRALGTAADVARPLFQEKRVEVVQSVEPGLPPVWADPDKLQQVLANLLSNAAKFSPEGGTVRIVCRRRGAYALFCVADEGPGIPRDRLNEVFERYTQVRDPQQYHPLGTGLGLTISREIVHRMGGRIWVESTEGKGTAFYFTLPLVEGRAALDSDRPPV